MPEVSLQRLLSTASSLKQATADMEAQETRGILRPNLGRSSTDHFAYPFASRRLSGESSGVALSVEPSEVIFRSSERKHIHFNEQVEQCIAVEANVDNYEDMVDDQYVSDSDSDDGVMMKRVKTKKRPISPCKSSKSKSATERKTIAMLPSTILKYREDTPKTRETAMKHSRNPLISPSSSQETLRPAKKSGEFFFEEEDNDDSLNDALLSLHSGWASSPNEGTDGGLNRSISSDSLCEESGRMRRTPSGSAAHNSIRNPISSNSSQQLNPIRPTRKAIQFNSGLTGNWIGLRSRMSREVN
jgi:hypothetical protein